MSLSQFSKTELLNIPLKKLACYLTLDVLKSEIKKLNRELKRIGLNFQPHIWISDDWFSPDGYTGFAVPFYILHPRLIRLMQEHQLPLEGHNPAQRMKILRHETGHALDNAFYLRRNKERQRIFGLSSTPYPDSYEAKAYSKQYVRHLAPHYAQAHPDEDWAETFAVYLDPKSNWAARYRSGLALEKLHCVQNIMMQIQSRPAPKSNARELESLAKNSKTLGEWLKDQQKSGGRFAQRTLDRALGQLFLKSEHKPAFPHAAAHFIQRSRRDLVRQVAAHTGRKQYEISFLLRNLQDRSSMLKLSLKNSEAESFSSLCQHLKAHALVYLEKGIHKIRM